MGSGAFLHPDEVDRIARRTLARADHALETAFKGLFQYFEERNWRVG